MKIAVIGAGISGLSCAYELQKLGYTVEVFEKESTVGGRMITKEKDGLFFDAGADFLAKNYTQLQEYAVKERIKWDPIKEQSVHRVIREGKAHSLMLLGLTDVLKFSVIPLRERLRLLYFLIKLKGSKQLNFFELSTLEEGELSASAFIEKHIGPVMRDYVADGFTALMQFHKSEDIDATAMKALFRMMVSKEHAFLIHATKGIQAIPNALAKSVSVQCNASVEKVIPRKGKVSLSVNKKTQVFDVVVIATPAPITNKIVEKKTKEQQVVLNAAEYAATIVVSFRIPRNSALEETFCTYVPFIENSTISGYTNEGRKGEGYETREYALLNVYVHEGAARKLMEKSDAVMVKKVKEELKKVCEVPVEELIFNDLQRWPLAMPKFNTRLVNAVRMFWPNQGQNRLFFTGDYLNSPWTEGAARCGKKVAMLVHEQLSKR